VEFPNANRVRNVPRLTNLSAKYWGGQSIWTHLYWPQPTHSHRQPSPTRATTQEFLVFIRNPESQLKGCHSGPQPIECHMLNPYPEPQLKDTFWATTQGTPTSPPLRYLRSLVDHVSQFQLIQFNTVVTLAWNTQKHPRSLRLKVLVQTAHPISLKLGPLAWASP